MADKNEIRKVLEEKINEAFFDLQTKSGIPSGDVDFSQAIRLEEITDNLTDLIEDILKFESFVKETKTK